MAFEVLVSGFEGDGWYFDFEEAAAGFAGGAGWRLPGPVFCVLVAEGVVAVFERVSAPPAVVAFVAAAYLPVAVASTVVLFRGFCGAPYPVS